MTDDDGFGGWKGGKVGFHFCHLLCGLRLSWPVVNRLRSPRFAFVFAASALLLAKIGDGRETSKAPHCR